MLEFADCLGTAWMSFKYCVAILGGILAACFITFGVLMRETGKQQGMTTNLIIAFGSFVALMSCLICVMMQRTDRQAKIMIDAMNGQVSRLQTSNQQLEGEINTLQSVQEELTAAAKEFDEMLAVAEKRQQERIVEFNAVSGRMQTTVKGLEKENQRLATENDELTKISGRLEELQAKYAEELSRLGRLQDASRREIDTLQALLGSENERVQQLDNLCEQQRGKIAEMTKQLTSLNELQRKSVQMIQMLSLYGDECKTMNVNLKEVSSTLRKTDDSLGLTAQELALQLTALQIVTQQLKRVAADRGINEYHNSDSDSDDPIRGCVSVSSETV